MILVVGATGLLGSMITQKLLDQDQDVHILVRDNSLPPEIQAGLGTPVETLIAAGGQPSFGDLKDPSSLHDACRGMTTVITTANSILRSGEDTIESVDLIGTKNLIKAAQEAGVNHFIYVSVYGADVDNPHPLLQAKAICEAELQKSGMLYTILQPGIFMEVWIRAVVGTPMQAGLPITLVEPGDHQHAFVSTRDVAAYAVVAADHQVARNATIRIGGPEAYSWQDIIDQAGHLIGQPLPVNYVAIGEPIPLLPEAMVPMLYGMETYESYINMNAASMVFGIQPTPLTTYLQGFLSTAMAA